MKHCSIIAAALALGPLFSLAAAAAQFKFPNQTITVPDGFEIDLVAGTNLVQRPVSIDYDEQGRLYVTDSSGSNEKVAEQLEKKPHRVVRLEDLSGDGHFDKCTTFADKLMFPEGAMWLDGSLYVSAPPSIWKLTDTHGDGVADVREEWHQGKTLTGCANDLHGPYLGPDGWIYWGKGAFAEQTYEINGKPFTTKASHIFRARPDHSGLEPVLTGGMDNPVGVAFSVEGERFLAGTFFFEPAGGGGGVRDGVIHAIYGGVYGKPHPEVLDPFKKTGDLMPVMIQFPASASCSVIVYRSGIFGDGFQNNLFVANFNLHNVTRHILEPKGATFKTKDSVFVSSDNPDFHPTCVLEDADGSLLIVDTGGWYKICCPTSQLYKPERLGAIYRLRRKGAPKIEDPRGLKMDWPNMTLPNLAKLLGDKRLYVQTRAIHELAKHGGKAIEVLVYSDGGKSIEARRNEIWAATQIDTPSARDFVRLALEDKDDVARSIALHSISLWRDQSALPQLLDVLRSGQPALQRVAAEALGRIGNAAAVPALLAAAAGPTDRILEHSLTYALIEIDDPAATAKGLDAPSSYTRRTALIALDQMDNGGLPPDRVTPLLGSSDPVLKQTAAWIVNHHNDWGGTLAGYFREQLSAKTFTASGSAELKDQLAQFARDPAVQDLLGESLRAGSREAQLATLQVIAQASWHDAPQAWATEMARMLAGKDVEMIRETVLAARSISPKSVDLSAALAKVAADASCPTETRLEALAAQQHGSPLDAGLFDFCVAQISSSQPVMFRVLASGVLAKATLSEDQLIALSATLKTDGPLEVGNLLGAFEKSTNETVGLSLIANLQGAKALSSLHAERLKPLFATFSPAVQKKSEALIASLNVDAAKQTSHINKLLASLKNGDRDRGQRVFASAKTACSACHSVGYMGGHVGPDLTRIGQVRTERDLLEAIVYPSASFVRGFEPMLVNTKSGENYSGIVKKDAPDEIILVTGPDTQIKIARNEITDLRPGAISIMPEGLTTQMTRQELADLIAFLRSLR
jgi:putative heme-binding domain-containing protein